MSSTQDDAITTPPSNEPPTPTPTGLSWEQALSRFERTRLQTKKSMHKIGHNPSDVLVFEIRQLTQAEEDEIEERVVKIGKGRRESVRVDVALAKREKIRLGVTRGPPGWKGTDRDILALPPDVRDDLADDIENFSSLNEEERHGFR